MLLLLRYFYLLQITVLLLTTPDRKGHHHLFCKFRCKCTKLISAAVTLPYLTPLPLILCMHHLKLARTIHYCSSPGTSIAKCWNQEFAVAPCQCFTPVGMCTTLPGCSFTGFWPHSWYHPSPLLPAASVCRLYPHDGYASYCGTPVRMLHCPLQPVLWKAYSNNFAQQSTLRMHR